MRKINWVREMCIYSVLKECALKEEIFITVITEVENIINTTQQKQVSISHNDPNHFLLGSVLALCTDQDLCSRKQWNSTKLIESFLGEMVKEIYDVIIADKIMPTNTWIKERVVQV